MQTILEAADKLIDRGLPIIAAEGKKPLGGKGWHRRKYSSADIEQLLSDSTDPAIGLQIRPGSCIDIEADFPAEEALFAELFAGFAEPPTPTFQSPRGLHRLFQCNCWLEATMKGIIHYRGHYGTKYRGRHVPKLAIRIGGGGKAIQSIIPPSRGRNWLPGRSIDDCEFSALPEPVVDRILAAVTTPCDSRNESNTYEHIQSQQKEYLKEGNRTQNKSYKGTQQDTAGSNIALCPLTLDEAIAATLPTGPGFRNRQIFVFARYLKGMLEYQDRHVSDLQSIVRKWYSQALPVISTKEFHETWQDFQNAWERVQFPIMEGPLAQIVREALANPLPEAAGRYDNPDLQKLVTVCAGLQQIHGSNPFFLSCRDAASLLGESATHRNRWNKYFHQLCADGVLQLHQTGSRGRASEFFYHGEVA